MIVGPAQGRTVFIDHTHLIASAFGAVFSGSCYRQIARKYVAVNRRLMRRMAQVEVKPGGKRICQ